MNQKQKNFIFNAAGIIGIILTIIVTWWAYQEGLLTSQEKMEAFIKPFGVIGIMMFIFVQIVQTVVPIIPGAMTILAGVAMYGMFWGTVWNYIGIVIGCGILFYLVRRYGKPFVQLMVKPKTYYKYISWLDKGDGFERFFIISMILPFMPADFICALAALTKMRFRRYMLIIITCKPIAILAYTIGTTKVIEFIYNLFV